MVSHFAQSRGFPRYSADAGAWITELHNISTKQRAPGHVFLGVILMLFGTVSFDCHLKPHVPFYMLSSPPTKHL